MMAWLLLPPLLMVSTADVQPTTGAALLNVKFCRTVVPIAAVYELLVPHASENAFTSCVVSPKFVKLKAVRKTRCENMNVTT